MRERLELYEFERIELSALINRDELAFAQTACIKNSLDIALQDIFAIQLQPFNQVFDTITHCQLPIASMLHTVIRLGPGRQPWRFRSLGRLLETI